MKSSSRSTKYAAALLLATVAALMIPNFVLLHTEPYGAWSKAALVLLPLGFYLLGGTLSRRSGVMVWWSFPFIFFAAFQIVLLYLFGNSIIAVDMFINVGTTNPGEATELLSNIYPAVILVCVLYLPLLWTATRHIRFKREVPTSFRRRTAVAGAVLFGAGLLTLIPANRASDESVVLNEVFPVNVLNNIRLCVKEYNRIKHFDRTSAGFSFDARRTRRADRREIYVYVVGEASRAANWQLYGYDRETNPRLARRNDYVLFTNLLTQSNTTHKSVPMILSSVRTDEHEELFRRKGIAALFGEAGFRTWFLSNQSPQGAMIDNLARDADSVVYLGHPRHDMQLLDTMRRIVAADTTDDLFFVLHCYGSHFSYHQRYPREAAHFLPDDDVSISRKHLPMIRNAYDNSIRYTDEFLDALMTFLAEQDACTALLYCADHGEDMLDDRRGRFLHASPTTTCYQLHVASLAWFSPEYRREFPERVRTAQDNAHAPATSHALFHTMADMAHIEGRFVDSTAALTSRAYDREAPRCYLNDHNQAVPFPRTGLNDDDMRYFAERGIAL